MRQSTEVEVQAFRRLLDAECIHVRLMMKNQLLQPIEGSLVRDALADLSTGDPLFIAASGFFPVAVDAKQVSYNVLDDESLLKNSASVHFLLDGHLELNTFRVRFGPHEIRIHQLYLAQPTQTAQTEHEQLFGLQRACQPLTWGLIVATTALAPADCDVLRYSFTNVNLCPQAVRAHVRGIGRRHLFVVTDHRTRKCWLGKVDYKGRSRNMT